MRGGYIGNQYLEKPPFLIGQWHNKAYQHVCGVCEMSFEDKSWNTKTCPDCKRGYCVWPKEKTTYDRP